VDISLILRRIRADVAESRRLHAFARSEGDPIGAGALHRLKYELAHIVNSDVAVRIARLPIMFQSVILPAILSFLAALAGGVMAYGTDPRWVHCGGWGIGLIVFSRRLQWPLIALSLILCVALLGVVISGKRRVWWLIGLLPVLALFGHRFITGPANRYAVLDEPKMVSPDEARGILATDYVVGVMLNGQAYAYPYATLYANPVVVQTNREKRMLLMWSAPANAATALDVSLEVKGRDLEVVSDPADSLLIHDSRSGQFLVALTGRAPGGGKVSGAIGRLPVVKQPWEQWLAAHPDTKVLAGGGDGPRAPIRPLDPAIESAAGSTSYARMVDLIETDPPVAIPTDAIGAAPANFTLGSTPVVLYQDSASGRVRAFDRHVEPDLIPLFAPSAGAKHKNVFMVDSDSGSGWSARGVAIDGDKALKGKKLTALQVQEDVFLGPAEYWYPGLKLIESAPTTAPSIPENGVVKKPITRRHTPRTHARRR
jgi:hypothetical protein